MGCCELILSNKEENEMMNLLRRLWSDEEGQGMVEYALIVALISIIAIASINASGTSMGLIWIKIRDALAGAD